MEVTRHLFPEFDPLKVLLLLLFRSLLLLLLLLLFTMEVTGHLFPDFDPLKVLVDLGSSLGLWLGLGAAQVK